MGFQLSTEEETGSLETMPTLVQWKRETMRKLEKKPERWEKGWGAGPFHRPPFPNNQSPKQPIITKIFTIPKHKWLDDGALRLINHKSFPLGKSINSVTPRHDIATYYPPGKFKYFTMAKCLSLLTKAGKGAWITQVDAADAYKQLYVRYEDLHQQCLEVINEEGQKEYYIEYCACFGSIYGNDIYSALEMHTVCV